MVDKTAPEPNLSMNPRIERDRQIILSAKERGRVSTFGAFVRLSGPGWLQSAVTLGGGSLSSSLYLGVLVGFGLLWLQPIAMIAGIVMLSAISYVTLSTDERPLRAINRHVNPVLGWGWLLASMLANLVWSMTQIALASASLQQNLLPDLLGPAAIPDPYGKLVVSAIILTISFSAVMLYTIGGWGMRLFEIVVKCLIGMVVLCFIGVVAKLAGAGQLDVAGVLHGFVPNLRMFWAPSEELVPHIAAVAPQFQSFWNDMIVGQQRDVLISAAATAVGINMTFLFPYSMLRKGWNRDFRGLAIFDLSTGLFFPFLIATSCVVIASAAQFHAIPAPGFLGEKDVHGQLVAPAPNLVGRFDEVLTKRVAVENGAEVLATLSPEERAQRIAAVPEADRRMAAMLVKRDSFNLADALAPLTGKTVASYVFGLGTLGMGLGALTMLMLINGLCLCEALNRPARGWVQRLGAAMVMIGALGPFLWKDAQLWLAVPTSMFAMTLLPLAYFTFFFMMNQKTLMGESMPRGGKRLLWNTLMGISATLATFGSVWTIWSKAGWYGIAVIVTFTVLVLIVHVARKRPATA